MSISELVMLLPVLLVVLWAVFNFGKSYGGAKEKLDSTIKKFALKHPQANIIDERSPVTTFDSAWWIAYSSREPKSPVTYILIGPGADKRTDTLSQQGHIFTYDPFWIRGITYFATSDDLVHFLKTDRPVIADRFNL